MSWGLHGFLHQQRRRVSVEYCDLPSTGHYPYSYPQVLKGEGRIQKILGKILQSRGESFYVGARREEGSPETLFKWDSDQEVPVHQYTEASSGDCLTLSSSGGSMVTRGVECSRKMKPLCIRLEGAGNNSAVSEVCEECSKDGECVV